MAKDFNFMKALKLKYPEDIEERERESELSQL